MRASGAPREQSAPDAQPFGPRRRLYETFDEHAILAQVDAVGDILTRMRKQGVKTMLAVRAKLTPEQRRDLMRLHRQRMGGEGVRRPPR